MPWVRIDREKLEAKARVKNKRYYRLRIDVLCGCAQEFEGVYRVIDVLSNVTLDELHAIIFDLFERFDGHAWKFCFGTDSPYSTEGRHYMPRCMMDSEPGDVHAAEETTLDSLDLKDGTTFLYLFDFGDDWLHQITVLSSAEASPRARKPWKLVEKKGKSPAQYPEEDEYEDEYEDDDE